MAFLWFSSVFDLPSTGNCLQTFYLTDFTFVLQWKDEEEPTNSYLKR